MDYCADPPESKPFSTLTHPSSYQEEAVLREIERLLSMRSACNELESTLTAMVAMRQGAANRSKHLLRIYIYVNTHGFRRDCEER